jgi:hypothetical protein
MKNETDNKEKSLLDDYSKIMEGFKFSNNPVNPTPPVSGPNDFFVKFSLYPEQESGIASTGTCYIQ